MTQNDKFGAFVFCFFMESTCNVVDEALNKKNIHLKH